MRAAFVHIPTGVPLRCALGANFAIQTAAHLFIIFKTIVSVYTHYLPLGHVFLCQWHTMCVGSLVHRSWGSSSSNFLEVQCSAQWVWLYPIVLRRKCMHSSVCPRSSGGAPFQLVQKPILDAYQAWTWQSIYRDRTARRINMRDRGEIEEGASCRCQERHPVGMLSPRHVHPTETSVCTHPRAVVLVTSSTLMLLIWCARGRTLRARCATWWSSSQERSLGSSVRVRRETCPGARVVARLMRGPRWGVTAPPSSSTWCRSAPRWVDATPSQPACAKSKPPHPTSYHPQA